MAARRKSTGPKQPRRAPSVGKSPRRSDPAQPRPLPRKRVGAVPRAPAERAVAGFPVVGFGASAGGLEAFRKVLAALPSDTGMAFVLIQHLDPTHESMLVELLARDTPMPVRQAVDGAAIEPNRVYVIAPHADLTVHDGALRLGPPRTRQGARMPFDFFLRSLAEQYRERAICVVLSGTGADGSAGLKSVSEHGGFVIAQDPDEAAYDGMPRAAIATGVVNLILPAAEIPHALIRYADHPYVTGARGIAPTSKDEDRALAEIVAALREQTAHDFARYKKSTLLRRIRRRMAAAGIKEMQNYIPVLHDRPEETELLAKDLLIHVTSFFRDPAAFETLATTVVADLLRRHTGDEPLRVWVAGCSTGEEAYSIAILFFEAFAAAKRSVKLQIFASDVSADAVAFARDGLYPDGIKADVGPERLQRFFAREDRGYRISRDLRDAIVFTVQDLLTDPPFSRLDLVSCRNLLIYLQADEQEKVLSVLHFALRDEGYLFLGGSETVGKLTDRFQPVSQSLRLFRRVRHGRPRETAVATRIGERARALWPRVAGGMEPRRPSLADVAQRALLNAHAPAAVLVNRNYQGLYFFGPTDRYLRVAAGEATRDMLGMLRDGLASKFRTAIRQASESHAPVRLGGARVRRNGDLVPVSIAAQPVLHNGDELLLVTFADEPRREIVRANETPAELARAAELEQELDATRKELESTIRDLEATNQELTSLNEEAVSVNEEFQSTNEELETSKEEMQSLNEELTTVNNQLQEALERQRKTANDLQNIVKSSGLAALFLDENLNIRYFTPAAAPLFSIIDSDIGRPLADLAIRFTGIDFLADARIVLANRATLTREIRSSPNTWYSCTTSPYRAQENQIEGVVVTLSDISELKHADAVLRAARALSEGILDTIRAPQIVLDGQMRVVSASRAFYGFFGTTPADTVDRMLPDVDAHRLDVPAVRAFIERVVNGEEVEQHEIQLDLPELGRRTFVMGAHDILDQGTPDRRFLVSFDDITVFREAEQQLAAAKEAAEQADRVKSRFLAAASHDLRQPLQTLHLLSSLLARRLTDDDDARRLVARFDGMLDVLSDMLDNILDINRLESGAFRAEVVDFRIGGLLERLRGEFALHAQAGGLGWSVVPCRHWVRSDPHLLEQIIRNLLSNAIKFTQAGKILLGCRHHADRLRIEVWDTGPGIPDEELQAIFEEFHQAPTPTPVRGRGVGLGLAIVRRMADLLGHRVEVRSRLGKGSVFSIEIPIGRAGTDAAEPREAGRSGTAANPHGTILIVEDDAAVRHSLAMLFGDDGYRILTAADGAQALALVADRSNWPDIAIADYMLPGGMNGLQTVAALRAATGRNIPVVILTADPTFATQTEIARLGYAHLGKPVAADALESLVDRLLPAVQALGAGGAPTA